MFKMIPHVERGRWGGRAGVAHAGAACKARPAGPSVVADPGIALLAPLSAPSWVLKQTVGTTPVIMGRKLSTTYHVTDR
jgi:hypothetical protein